MPKALGSAEALRTGEGDCTEYASVFCDLCRVAGIPARGVAVFNLAKAEELTSDEPNHNTAEVFLATHGWVPVDPNLGSGKYDRPVGFAKASTTEIVITREGAWVWGTWLPPEGAERDKPKPDIQVTVQWHAKVIQEGSAEELLLAFGKRRGS